MKFCRNWRNILSTRLLKDKCLEATWQDSAEGLPPRKYYSLTPMGEEYLKSMSEEWGNLLEAVSELKGEEE